MRELWLSAATVATAIAVAAAVVLGAGDRSLFVPPPEVVAEEFARELAMARYSLAHQRMSDVVRAEHAEEQLRSRFEPLRATTGKINKVDAESMSVDDDGAMAKAIVEGDRGTMTLFVTLSREHSLWVVDSWTIAAATVK